MANWHELPAGRELDRLIAERMGAVFDENEWYTDERGQKRVAPYFSTDMNSAITLWQSDTENYYWGLDMEVTTDPVHYIGFYPGSQQFEAGQISADTPALAICRAWLAWSDSRSQQQDDTLYKGSTDER